jgi:hypothetical protein
VDDRRQRLEAERIDEDAVRVRERCASFPRIRSAIAGVDGMTSAVWQSASPNTLKMRSATGRKFRASIWSGRTIRQRWKVVVQSSIDRTSPPIVWSGVCGSGFLATARDDTARASVVSGSYGPWVSRATADPRSPDEPTRPDPHDR